MQLARHAIACDLTTANIGKVTARIATGEQMLCPRAFPTVRILVFFILSCTLARQARADDTLVTLEAGGLVPAKSSKIVMESENLQISTHQVNVNYVFRNTSAHDVDAVVAFPLPELDGGTVENSPIQLPSKDPVNFMSFKVLADGKPLSPSLEIRAFKNGHDITDKLRSLGLPISVLDPSMKDAYDKLSAPQRKGLEQDELLFSEEIQAAGKKEQIVWAWWQTRVRYYWTQHFPGNESIRVSHSYRPVVGGSYIPQNSDGASTVGHYCGGALGLKQIADVKARLPKKDESDISLVQRNIKFVLTTANNWDGPIRDFHLVIDSDSPDDIVMTCLPSVRKISPTRYQLNLKNFRPDRDLDLMILQANK